jgi:3-oxoacyl-[acyl-carrier-protein] synthase-3
MQATIAAIAYHLPKRQLTNVDLAAEFPDWSVEKIEAKTGISCRHVAANGECASDLGVHAAEKLFHSGAARREEIDYLLFCTQSPDYFLPTTACLLQNRLLLRESIGAIDVNQGCSGYIYGLGLAKGLIETGQARTVLLITAETYSKFIHPGDKSVRTLFGDAAAATLIRGVDGSGVPAIGPFVYGTDGRGGKNLIVPEGGLRTPLSADPELETDEQGNTRTQQHLYMNGAEIFRFTLDAVPKSVAELLATSGKGFDDIDLFVFHQANRFMLEHLQRKMKIPTEKFLVSFREYGNTVSSTIPIALADARQEGVLRPGALLMLVGFGVGYSWGATLVRWTAA